MSGRATMTYVTLAGRLRALEPSCGAVRVVAVDGPSAAGKSTFAARLPHPVIGADDFPVPWDGDPLSWWPPLSEQVLAPLAGGRPGAFRRYDWRSGGQGEPTEVPVTDVLVVEGVGAARRGAPVAYRIWVDAPYGVRLRRALTRGDDPALWERWALTESRHFAADGTRDRCDLYVDGTTLTETAFTGG